MFTKIEQIPYAVAVTIAGVALAFVMAVSPTPAAAHSPVAVANANQAEIDQQVKQLEERIQEIQKLRAILNKLMAMLAELQGEEVAEDDEDEVLPNVPAELKYGKYVGYMNGNVFIITERSTKAAALENCELNAKNNPGSYVLCEWDGQIIAEIETPVDDKDLLPPPTDDEDEVQPNVPAELKYGKYVGYMNGNVFIVTERSTKAAAVENCERNAKSNPNGHITCEWDGQMIAEYNAPVDKKPITKMSPEDFVTHLYACTFDRKPDQRGFSNWVNALSNQSINDVYKGFFNSKEYQLKPTSDTDYVTQMYDCILFRTPDQKGAENWVEFLKRNESRDAVIDRFLNSVEFKNRIVPKLPGMVTVSNIESDFTFTSASQTLTIDQAVLNEIGQTLKNLSATLR